MFLRAQDLYRGTGRTGTLVRAVVGSACLRIVGMAIAFLVGVQLARGLGPAGYGIYGIAMSLVSLAMMPTEFGLPLLVTRESAIAEAAGDRSMIRALLSWSSRFVAANTLGIVVLTLIAIFLLVPNMGSELRSALMWGLALLPLLAIANVSSAALRGTHHVVEGQLVELLIRPGCLSIALFLSWIWTNGHDLTPALAMSLNVLTAAIGAGFVVWRLWILLRDVGTPPRIHDKEQRWLRSAIPLALGEGMRILSGNFAILILGLLAPAKEVGLYRAAAGVYTAATLPSALLNVACSPMLASLYAEGKKSAIQRVNAWMALILVVTSAACLIPFVLAGGPILSALFGRDFAGSNAILIVLLAGELASAFIGHPTPMLNMMHHERTVTKFSLVALLINLIICLTTVPHYGAIGAALGVFASQFAWRFLCRWHARRALGLESSILAWMLR